jgi:dihydroorotase
MKYELVILGGDVVDPGSGLRGHMDIAISGGKIAEVTPSLGEADARKTISAKDRLVIPGLVDVHAHIFVNCSDMGEHTDRLCNSSGVTTVCDAGSAGSANFAGLRFVVDKAVRTRTRALSTSRRSGLSAPPAAANSRTSPTPTRRAAPKRSRRIAISRSG